MRSRAMIVAAVLAAALVSGGWLMQAGVARTASGGYARARLFEQVVTHVERFYIDSVADEEVYRKAVAGMLLELHDPHSTFLTAERLAKLNESTTGRYAGVGIQMDVRDGWITVVTPLPGTPAERAGLLTGDRIVEIDGRPTKGWTSDEAMKALRGQPGSTVRVVVERPGAPAKLPFVLTRQEIQSHSVRHALMLRDSVGYVDLMVFSEVSADELRGSIDSLRIAGMRALIFDLRGDPGGLLDQGVAVADLFLDAGKKIVSMHGRGRDADREYLDRLPQRWPQLPLVVLIDSSSASASEIVAGALQDHDRALIVGTTSYGKGSAQSLFPMVGGGALKLTTALWFTPSGRSINRSHADASDTDDGDALETLGDDKARPRFKTDAGRTVLGGGGIIPDVVVSDSALSGMERTFQLALGKHVPDFRDALTTYALGLKARNAIASPAFTVTPVMRAELYEQLRARAIPIPRSTYDAAAPLIDRVLGYQIARYVFGPQAEFERSTRDDATIVTALSLLRGADTPAALIQRSKAKTKEGAGSH